MRDNAERIGAVFEFLGLHRFDEKLGAGFLFQVAGQTVGTGG
jgi:hypothetical protein